jgi:hypothetical protein
LVNTNRASRVVPDPVDTRITYRDNDAQTPYPL